MVLKLLKLRYLGIIILLLSTTHLFSQQITVTGLGNTITSGDVSPTTTDDTDFGNVATGGSFNTNTFTIAEVGGTNINNVVITISGSADFTPASNTIGQIRKNKTATFSITFTPTITGVQTATVTISSSDGTNTPYTFTIQGNGITPAPEIDILGNGTSIADADPTPSVSDDTDFGTSDVTTGTVVNTFTIQNTGTLNLNLTGTAPTYVAISGTNAADFSVTANPTTPIIPGGSTTFNITFNPSATGLRTALLTIANNDSVPEDVYTFAIQGTGTIVTSGSQDINVRGNAVTIPNNDTTPITTDNTDFGSLNAGFSTTNTFEIQNTHGGGSPSSNVLTISGITITGANAADFTVTSSITNIERNSSQTFTITFNPSAIGLRTATVTIANNSSNSTEQPYVFKIQGTGTAPSPEIDVVDDSNDPISDGSTNSPSSTNSTAFGSTPTSTSISYEYTIENNGAATLNISSVTSSNADFAISVAPASSVSPGNSTSFFVTFTPSGTGSISATITINNNDTAPENVYTFTVQGEGTAAPPEYTAYYENFDASNGGWTIITSTGDTWLWTNAFPATAIEIAEGGFWRNNLYDNYVNNTNIVVESPQYDFTGLQNLKISIDVKYKTENNRDGMRILYSVGGGAYTLLGASGSGTNWYEDNVSALGSQGWNDNSHTVNTTFTHNKFINAAVNISDVIFSNQSNVKFRIEFSSDASSSDDGVAFDNFRVHADPIASLSDASVAPADITSNLRLWLKTNTGISATDNTALTNWEDQAYSTTLDKEDANAAASLAPTYRDSSARNMNYNPVLDFDNNNVEYMNGKGGFYSTDYFAVFRSDDVVDTSTGTYTPGRQFAIGGRYGFDNFHEDPTGLGMGSTSGRYTDEILSHNINSFPTTASVPNDNSYGRAYVTTADTFSNHVLIVNVKSNAIRTASEIYKNGKRVDNITGKLGNGVNLNFKEFNNTPFLIGTGRSGLAGRTTSQLNGMLTEIISYSSPNSAINQQKIQSYLGIKYGVTLQDASSSLTNHRINDVDYIDSQGTVIWDTSANTGFNYDIGGIGRDDASLLNQKQSRSQNDEVDAVGPTSGFLTMGLTDIYDTNSSNPNSCNDREFLVWGNNNVSLDGAALSVEVNMSEDIGDPSLITNVSFEAIPRIWKVIETGGDVSKVKVSIPKSIVRTAAPPDGRYLMFISDSGIFDPTADYRVMTETSGILYADYDFDGTEYITFGWAPEREFVRSIYFDPTSTNYIDIEDALDLNTTEFTVSSWIKRGTSSGNTSILSKRDASYTEGYDFKITAAGLVEMSWGNSGAQNIISDVVIPMNEWHQVAVIYNNGTTNLYIDGVLDKTASLTAPVATSQSFFIAAAGKNTPVAHFHGNIDEVRVWDKALSEGQLRYIMNQEIENNSNFINGKIIPQTISNNEVSSIPWSSLAGYYPMSVYTYTNTKDESGNGHQGALKNLKTVDWQTAPLPYESNAGGDWDTKSNWLNGSVQTIPGGKSLVDNTVTVNWNIVKTNHNLDVNNTSLPSVNEGNRSVLGLIVESNTVKVEGDNSLSTGYGLTVSHYLKLDGKIDLEGESQLIQSEDSDLDEASIGLLERDQQGTASSYNYNYWSSPVSPQASGPGTNNAIYTIAGVLKDGTNPLSPAAINFQNPYNAADNAATSPITLSNYWMYRFNGPSDDYNSWVHVGKSGNLNTGEGFTLKGADGTKEITDTQNYVFQGKPNNGTINLTLGLGKDYLLGNPYPSALDANEFINDNLSSASGGNGTSNVINGTLYFWDHFATKTHVLREYVGGYGYLTKIDGTKAISNDVRINSNGMESNKRPSRYIPVTQGFFVVALDAGTITFKNKQRKFVKEATDVSTFFKSNNQAKNTEKNVENDLKIWLNIDLPSGYHRQLLLGEAEGSTNNFDIGFDAPLIENNLDDAYWYFDDEKYVIQGVPLIDETQEFPIGIKVSNEGLIRIKLDDINYDYNNINIYVKDNTTNEVFDIKYGIFETVLAAGTYNERFSIVFIDKSTLDINDEYELTEKINIYIDQTESILNINKSNEVKIENISLYNMLGQKIKTWNNNLTNNNLQLPVKLNTGVYLVNIKTEKLNISKKIIIN